MTITIDAILTASLVHGGGTDDSNIVLFRRESIVAPDGSIKRVPVFSGNAVRGVLRRSGAWLLASRLGWRDNPPPIKVVRIVSSGGALTQETALPVDIDNEARRIPHLGLFGGSWKGSIHAGSLIVGKLYPVCAETAHIARGCKFSCRFCSLGWHAPLRENSAEAVNVEIKRSPGIVHLQAGDAESHSGITKIRAALKAHGGFDTGWTGRLDTTQTSDEIIDSNKRYAFGVEGMTWLTRRIVGKGHLTDDRLIDDTVAYLARLDDDTAKGRAAWHMIAGLPGQRPDDPLHLAEVLHRIDSSLRHTRNLSIHWQPFQPLPGTPMQWFAGGGGARRLADLATSGARSLRRLRVRHHAGRTDRIATICSILSRSDHRGALLLAAYHADSNISIMEAEQLTGTTAGALDPDTSPPWSFVQDDDMQRRLRRSYDHAAELAA